MLPRGGTVLDLMSSWTSHRVLTRTSRGPPYCTYGPRRAVRTGSAGQLVAASPGRILYVGGTRTRLGRAAVRAVRTVRTVAPQVSPRRGRRCHSRGWLLRSAVGARHEQGRPSPSP